MDWESRLEASSVPKDVTNRLVMNYLLIEGYKEPAEKLAEESKMDAPVAMEGVDLEALKARKEARVAIQRGDVQEAIDKVNAADSAIIQQDPLLHFHLLQQKLIELIREGRTTEAVEFAQRELGPRGEENEAFLAELQKTLTLLVFEDKSKGSVSELLDFSQRQRTASELNSAILRSDNDEKESQLPKLLKLLHWVQEKLSSRGQSFLEMDLKTGTLKLHC